MFAAHFSFEAFAMISSYVCWIVLLALWKSSAHSHNIETQEIEIDAATGQIDSRGAINECHHETCSERQPRGGQAANQSTPIPYTSEYAYSSSYLNCKKFGGPSDEAADEMVYWKQHRRENEYRSPYINEKQNEEKYLTFEPDSAGWGNKRMSFETTVALALATGRTLVLPPRQAWDWSRQERGQPRKVFGYEDFYDLGQINSTTNLDIVSFEEFLKREGVTGRLKDEHGTGQSLYPPGNRTVWDSQDYFQDHLWSYMRRVSQSPSWDYDRCVVGISSKANRSDGVMHQYLRMAMRDGMDEEERISGYDGNPTSVDALPHDRLRELLAHRKQICVYNQKLQNAKVMHIRADPKSATRLLVHFYALFLLEDWRQDLYIKRFIRDNLRYVDEIQCVSARIVQAIRERAIVNGNPKGEYDSFHIRRGDFLIAHPFTEASAQEIYENVHDVLEEGATVFIATDERDKSFFDPLRKHYHLLFLDDFAHLYQDISNSNFLGMLDQRVASLGRTFVGVYYSTFTGFINRMRAYHSQKDQTEGFKHGTLNSYYYMEKRRRDEERQYTSVQYPLWAREFPIGWRDIDYDLKADDLGNE